MSRRPRSRRARLTREGAAWAALCVAVAAGAWFSGNNLLVLVLGFTTSTWIVDAWLGPWNLRHLTVRRELPAEFFAETPARGAFHLHNKRRWLPSAALVVEEVGGEATAHLDRLPAGEEGATPTRWRFLNRGPARLGDIWVSSTFPFGLVKRARAFSQPADLLVFVRPSAAEPRARGGKDGAEGEEPAGRGAIGDIDDLRPYVEGDPPRRIHAGRSARLGEPIVVLRTDEIASRVDVVVRDRHGRAWEHELARASAEVLRAFQRGCRVGLVLPDSKFEARNGPSWRRTLLEVLARQPDRGG